MPFKDGAVKLKYVGAANWPLLRSASLSLDEETMVTEIEAIRVPSEA